jgi:glutaminase
LQAHIQAQPVLKEQYLLLAKPQRHIEPIHQRMVNALMMTCGLYEESAIYAVQIGLPMKSGVTAPVRLTLPLNRFTFMSSTRLIVIGTVDATAAFMQFQLDTVPIPA